MWETPILTFRMIEASFSIILHNRYLFLYLILVPSAFAKIINWCLSDIHIDQITKSILAYLGGILGLSLFSFGIVLLKIKPSPALGYIVAIIALLVLIGRRRDLHRPILPNLILVVIFAFFILLLRLIFIQHLIVPPYADSVTHLQIAKDFLNPDLPPRAFYRISLDFRHYYHFGFHALAAWLSGITSTPVEQTILLLGQYFQMLAILSIYPIAYILTQNLFSTWAVMSIAGLLLPIPAYASNWGKFPAIASLTGISFVLALIAIYIQNRPALSKKIWWLIGFAIFSTACLHSRSVYIFLLVTCWLILYFKFNTFPKGFKINEGNINYVTITVLILLPLLFIYMVLIEAPVTISSLFLFIGLCTFALSANFVLTSSIIVFVLATGAGILFPILSQLHFYKAYTIFDRPYLVIFFYLPASFLFWLGLEGGIQLYINHKLESWRRYLLTGVLVTGMVNAIFFQNHLPSNCCIYINNDDLFSFEWMKQNIPKGTIIGIAATGMPGNFLPADGGAWIESVIGTPTRKLDSKGDFLAQTWKLCVDNVTYFYVDNLENSFDEFNLIEAGAIYKFGLGSVHIYHLECSFLK